MQENLCRDRTSKESALVKKGEWILTKPEIASSPSKMVDFRHMISSNLQTKNLEDWDAFG